MVGSMACGDQLKIQVEVNQETGVIDKAVFKAFGCGSAIASSAYATEILKGMHVDDALNIKNSGIHFLDKKLNKNRYIPIFIFTTSKVTL